MIDLIVRYCGHGEWLPIIRTVDGYGNGTELYRGERVTDDPDTGVDGATRAFRRARMIWAGNGTGDIIEFKRENPGADLP